MEPVLVIMAAGMGSRYGGLKQIDPVDEQGNLIIDFSIYDAIKAGFKKIIFVIKKEIEKDFREVIGDRIANYVETTYVYQELNHLPEGYQIPLNRVKPWGTGHAVLSCKDMIHGPFAVINADDYYGQDAFRMLYHSLISQKDDEKYHYTMIGYVLYNTLTDHGHVARGICSVSEDGHLEGIKERTQIERKGATGAAYSEDNGATWTGIDASSIVSMNLWGFNESILRELEERFCHFLDTEVTDNPLKAEYFLPSVVGELITEKKAFVQVLTSPDKWFGVTYKQDKEAVTSAIAELKKKGIYPDILWK
ncbi:sugar phosphate nucleotidyltransferase [Anaerocolumna sp. MB42-C2]|uniref:sugar phosphate nucleotidyltransferase n=1 Tax=Anaerocolumna sp. MB42-C2 TaxID=3070997 RepID=UPI0027E1A8E2|nr:sugar phosphate nucleotidyltransferase [Anaerocolumna sp. MB42-C2]WMJ85788.1 sugar phosphate nucleotidyltransferase [Anaerocolumna sp. MB42-C2]